MEDDNVTILAAQVRQMLTSQAAEMTKAFEEKLKAELTALEVRLKPSNRRYGPDTLREHIQKGLKTPAAPPQIWPTAVRKPRDTEAEEADPVVAAMRQLHPRA